MLHFTGFFLGRVPKWSRFVLIWCKNRDYLYSFGGFKPKLEAYLLLPAEACLMM